MRFDEAAKLSPNWADPLKYRADLLAAQGKKAEAISNYDEALKLADLGRQLTMLGDDGAHQVGRNIR